VPDKLDNFANRREQPQSTLVSRTLLRKAEKKIEKLEAQVEAPAAPDIAEQISKALKTTTPAVKPSGISLQIEREKCPVTGVMVISSVKGTYIYGEGE